MQTYIVDLPNELLGTLYRKLGLKVALEALPANSKLHTAWQEAVESVSLPASGLCDDDVRILAKYANLERLRLHGPQRCGSDSERGIQGYGNGYNNNTIPSWRMISKLAPQLTQLKTIHLEGVQSAFSLLTALAGLENVRKRLHELKIEDGCHYLVPDDLWALHGMTSLHSLHLHCCKAALAYGWGSLEDVFKELRDLRTATLETDEVALPDFLSVFPGSITQLTSLTVKSRNCFYYDAIPEAVKRLDNLQRLETNYALERPSSWLQSQTLTNLTALTELNLTKHDALPEPQQEDPPFFTMLDKLPSLVRLIAPQNSIADPFHHPSLQQLTVQQLHISEAYRGTTAEHCCISDLELDCIHYDNALQNLPLLPALKRWCCPTHPIHGRLFNLARMLQQQAGTIEVLDLRCTAAPFEELLPRALPACHELSITCSRTTLMLLARCDLPALQSLELHWLDYQHLALQADLGWLAEFPALKKVSVCISTHAPEAAAQLRVSLQAMLRARGVHVTLCHRWN